jgi:hypothetical protein
VATAPSEATGAPEEEIAEEAPPLPPKPPGALLRINPVLSPGAGADWSWIGPTFGAFRVSMVTAVLTTSAAAGNRIPALQVLDASSNVLAQLGLTSLITASAAAAITWGKGLTGVGASQTVLTAAFPDVVWPPGVKLQTSTGGLLAGDQWSAIIISYVLEPE